MTVTAPAPVAAEPRKQTARRQTKPFHLLVPVASIATLLIAIRPVLDPDVYWHVRLGGDILRRHSVHSAGSGWSVLPPVHAWASPEWASDVLLHAVVAAFGWRGMLVFNLVCSLAFLGALAWALLPGRDARSAGSVFAITSISLATFLQARPQTISLVLIVGLSVWTGRVLRQGRLPNPVLFLVMVWAWAQFHGLWLVAPAFLAFAVGVRLLDGHGADERARALRGATLVVASLLAGCINPLGLSSLTLPFRLHAATATIAEWKPTTFRPYFTWGLLVLVALAVRAWARHGRRVPRAELAWVAGVTIFGLMAYRNVAVATLLLAPVVADRLSRSGRETLVSDREAKALRLVAVGLTAAAVVVGVVATTAVQPIPSTAPLRLVHQLDDGAPHRVLNDYNLGGMVLAFAGPHVRVAVDGRADYYGGTFLNRYADLMNTTGGWRRLFHRLDPDTALIGTRTSIHDWLLRHGWREASREGIYSLLYRGPQ